MAAPGDQGFRVRATAARVVARVLSGATLETALERHLPDLARRDIGFCRELSVGTIRHFYNLDPLLKQLLTKPMRRRDAELHALALTGLYQLTYLRVPEHAAVAATVGAAGALGFGRAKGFLNAVLRRYQREAAAMQTRLSEAARHAHPVWLWDALGNVYPAQREAIARANNERPPMTLRINLRRTRRETFLEDLRNAGLEANAGCLCKSAVTLERAADVSAIPGFSAGLCSVQDEAAQLAAGFLAPRRGERVLDACAAPGGKTGHLLELEPAIDLVAMDSNAKRLHRVEENLSRLNLRADVLCGDASAPPAQLGDGFDAMLVDAPCSATGVIRRHPDVKVLRRATDIAGFQDQQMGILAGLWPRLNTGGRLLYVTCSVLPAENDQVVEAFLGSADDAQPLPLQHTEGLQQSHGLQFLPSVGGTDGLYFCLLQKRGQPCI